ncbi:MAG: PDZ domain-containing protein [Planctomycetota bacterium]|jgi:C-terminal processing protease CtpA/Prc
MKIAKIALFVALCAVIGFSTGCSFRPQPTEQETLYYQYGGQNLRRKRTQTEMVEREEYNSRTKTYFTVRENVTVVVLEIDGPDGRIEEFRTSPEIANQLQEGKPIPSLTPAQASKAGFVGNSVEASNVYVGGNAGKGGMKNGDIIISYNGETALGVTALRDMTRGTSAGDTVKVNVLRDGQGMVLTVNGGDLEIDMEEHWR